MKRTLLTLALVAAAGTAGAQTVTTPPVGGATVTPPSVGSGSVTTPPVAPRRSTPRRAVALGRRRRRGRDHPAGERRHRDAAIGRSAGVTTPGVNPPA